MLMLYNQFVLTHAIRSPLYLLNPTISPSDEVRMPRYSVIHDLDLGSDRHFPSREQYYYKEIPKNKKIPVQHIMDLDVKEDVSTLLNKYSNQEVRKWKRENIRQFIERDLINVPNKDVNLVSVFNYNIIKDLYKLKTSLTSNYNKHKNISTTFWNGVYNAVKSDPDGYHIVKVELPNFIPSMQILNRILSFPPVKIGRIIDDRKLLELIEIYQWLTNDTKGNSTLKDIDDTNCKSIILEITYKGHSAFLPLNVIRGVSEESELQSSLKVNNVRLRKLFLVSLKRIQDKITKLLNDEEVIPDEDFNSSDEDETPNTDKSLDLNREDPEFDDQHEEDLEEEPKIQPLNSSTSLPQEEIKSKRKLSRKEFKEERNSKLKEIDKLIEKTDLDDMSLDTMLDEEEDTSDTYIDDMFTEKMNKVDKEKPSIKDKEVETEVFQEINDAELNWLATDQTPEEISENYIEKAISNKTHSASEIRAMRKLKEERRKLKNPYTKDEIDNVITASPMSLNLEKEITKIDEDVSFVNEDLKIDVISNFDKQYITKVMQKDIVRTVANLEKANIVIKSYEKEDNITSVDRFETHKVTLKPLDGKESTIYFRVPKIEEDGTFMVSGTKYRMRKTRSDLPIRKISPIRVALTSNYGKFFISRTERKTNDKEAYILKHIRDDYLNDNLVIKKLIPTNRKILNSTKPNIYVTLATNFKYIKTATMDFYLEDDSITNHVKPEVAKKLESEGYTFIGATTAGDIIVIDKNEVFYNYTKNLSEIGTIETILNIDPDKVPKSFSVMKVLGSDIPLGVCLSYYLGLNGLIKLTKTEYSVIGPRQQHKASKDELVLRFEDHKLILKTDTVEKQLLFNGFLFYKEMTKSYPLNSFNDRNIYLTTLESRDKGLIYLKELTTLRELFLDPITIEVLEDMKEPTNFIPLLLRANQLLSDFNHLEINDPNLSRIRGYDRVPGLMYRALAESVREHRIKGKSSSKVSIDPYKVWNYITQDSTVKSRDDINPLLQLKENEAMTLTGQDGLSTGAIPKELRRYHKNDVGLVSEATVDSKDTAINTYLTPYAKLKNVRGVVDKDNVDYEKNPGMAFSSPIQATPLSEYDDPKRLNMANIQYSHTIPSPAYKQSPLRTGYEYLVPHRVNNDYAVMAEEDGVVTNVTDKLVTVMYKSGVEKNYLIGTKYGAMEGSYYAHKLVTDLSKGHKFKKSDPLLWHKDFFERDWLDKSKIVFKTTVVTTMALAMNSEVFEDSSAISKELAGIITTEIAKEKTFVLDFSSNIIGLLPVGSKVDPNSTLFTIADENTDASNLSEQAIAMLQNLSAMSPRSKVYGIIDRYEVKYNGDVSDMSPSLQALVSKIDKQTREESKGTSFEVKNNRVTAEYRSSGKSLTLDTLEFKIFIKVHLSMSGGDKLVYGNQLKSVVGEVYTYDVNGAESGDRVDAMYSYIGVINRVTNSPILMGTTNRLSRFVSRKISDLYFSK